MTRTTLFLLGVCVGAAVPVIVKTVRPYGAYAIAGGMIAYESLCDASETAREAISATARASRKKLKQARGERAGD